MRGVSSGMLWDVCESGECVCESGDSCTHLSWNHDAVQSLPCTPSSGECISTQSAVLGAENVERPSESLHIAQVVTSYQGLTIT